MENCFRKEAIHGKNTMENNSLVSLLKVSSFLFSQLVLNKFALENRVITANLCSHTSYNITQFFERYLGAGEKRVV